MNAGATRQQPGLVFRTWGCLLAAAAMLSLQACATVTTGATQPVAVETAAGPQAVNGAQCQLSNDKGAWSVVTPGVATVRSSYQDLSVRCEAPSYEAGVTLVKSATKGMVLGNVLVGGLIGASVDVASGAAYQYPSSVVVSMGAATGRPPDTSAERAAEHVAASAASPQPGDRWEYEVEDRFTGLRRLVVWTVDRVEGGRIVFDGGQRIEERRGAASVDSVVRTGDLEVFEPPQGWGRPRLDVGQAWQERFEARDGLPRSPVQLDARVLRHEVVNTPAGRFNAAVVVYEGMALRESGNAPIPHPTLLTLWIDLASRRVVRFESEVRASLGSRPVRPSRERAELVRVVSMAGRG